MRLWQATRDVSRAKRFLNRANDDFWRKVEADSRFCVVCFNFSDSEAKKIPPILKQLLRHPPFKTKAQRMGCVIRYTSKSVTYYTRNDGTLRTVSI
jgi:hypothetical protein